MASKKSPGSVEEVAWSSDSRPRSSRETRSASNERKVVTKKRSGVKLEMMLSDAEATDGGGGGGAGSDLRASFRASFGGGRPAGGSMGELVPLRSAVARTTHFDPDFGSVRKYSDRLLRPHRRGRLESVDFPGFGGAFRLRAPEDQLRAIAREQKSRHSDHDKLGEWLTTAICGNDILSSCLYVSGVVTAEAGVLSPLCLAAVAGILYLLRFVYGEAITALPMNGGSYSLLLNTASKPVASVAACLGIIAYVATAVVSGTSAAEYLRAVCPGLDADRCAVGLLFAFAVLAFLGISESAVVALAMFVGHVLTLAGLCAAGLWFLAVDGGGTAWANWEGREYPDVLVGGQVLAGSAGTALFFGLSAAMLGVSGFETAAQYVEEQKPGVFVKYVSGVVTAEAGVLSPLCLAAVAGILYLLRFVYGEAITALPMNGGSYSLLLNTASKPVASVAACLGIIAYVATAVVSGTSAAEYLRAVCPGLDADRCAVGLLFAFAVLAFLGISESAVVALAMFVGHVLTLAGLCAAGLWFLAVDGGGTAWANWEGREYPDVLVGGQVLAGSAGTALFFGLSAAMLGVSGFETAAQYVEEQKPGVFVKCLRNMWVFVAVFNPLISALSFCTLPMEDIQREADHVLSAMAAAVGARAAEALGTRAPLAKMAETWVAVDAFVVLSGTVLTAYVGVGGLIRQMAADRVLPQLLLRRNAWRRTNHHIIFGFFLLCTSQVLLLRGDTAALAGVYTFAFMGVLCIFTVGTMLLKAKRGRLPREVEAPWPFAVAALLLLLAALVGNVLSKPDVLSCFFLYVGAVGAVVLAMFQRLNVSRLLFSMVKNISEYCWTRGFGDNGEEEEEEEEEEEDREPHNKALMQRWREGPCLRWLRGAMVSMSETPYVFFCKYDDLYQINKAIIYVQRNEVTRHLLIVNVCGPGHPEPEHLPDHVEMFDAMYPKVKISLLSVVGDFGPPLVEWLSVQLEVPQNMMFITCPDSQFKHKLASLGGVRVISH